MSLQKERYLFRVVLSNAKVVPSNRRIRCIGVGNQGSPCLLVVSSNASNASLASFNLRHLKNEGFAACTFVSCFGSAMFEFALVRESAKVGINARQGLTGSVEYESVVPYRRIVST